MSKHAETSQATATSHRPSGDESYRHGVADTRKSRQELSQIDRLRAGDEAAFSQLLDQYPGALLRLAMVFVHNRAVAEEVVQETWVGVITGLPRFEGRSSLKTWIFRILTNRAKTRGVRESRTVPLSSFGNDSSASEPAVDPSRFRANGRWAEAPRVWDDRTPERLVATHEAMEHLERAISQLPPNQQAVVTLRDVEGLESKETCNMLEITETNQRVLLHRARSKLRSVLEEYLDQE